MHLYSNIDARKVTVIFEKSAGVLGVVWVKKKIMILFLYPFSPLVPPPSPRRPPLPPYHHVSFISVLHISPFSHQSFRLKYGEVRGKEVEGKLTERRDIKRNHNLFIYLCKTEYSRYYIDIGHTARGARAFSVIPQNAFFRLHAPKSAVLLYMV